MVRLIAIAVIVVGGSACRGSRFTFPTSDQLVPSLRRAAGTESAPEHEVLARLERGRVLAVTECSDCHRQYWPAEYSPREWPALVHNMGKRASLDPGEIEDLELYFHHASRWSLEERSQEEESQEEIVFTKGIEPRR